MTDIPNDLKFTETHEWLKDAGDELIIGITEHAQELLGDMVFVELPEVGRIISAEDEIGVVESVKAASDLYSPISGVVTAVNEAVSEDPSLLNRDPYGAGWLIKIKASDRAEINDLLTADDYKNQLAEEH